MGEAIKNSNQSPNPNDSTEKSKDKVTSSKLGQAALSATKTTQETRLPSPEADAKNHSDNDVFEDQSEH